MIFAVSWATWVLLCLLAAALTLIFSDKDSKEAPGPRRWPIIGSIPFMAKFSNTVEAFKAISREYGDFATLKLGSVNAIVVSGVENIREVLVTRAPQFDSRPDFKRFDMLFEGNRNNSLAFADWSENLKKRREIVGHHSFPKKASARFDIFQEIANDEVAKMVGDLKETVATAETQTHHLKSFLTESTFKIFLKYFCGTEVTSENREDFLKVMKIFDDIFQEMNSSCIGDIFPSVMPICNKNHLSHIGEPLRKFTLKHCVEPKQAAASKMDENNNNESETETPKRTDLLDEFLDRIGKDSSIDENTVLFALEDMIGGHSAISNSLTLILLFIAQNPHVQEKIRQEVQECGNGDGDVLLTDNLSYTEATIWEAMRHISSPLVPHVANADVELGGFPVKKGTVLFLNNGELNSSPKLWTEPNAFEPERFLKGGQVSKPDFFVPFGTGRRSCLGFKLLLYTSILTVTNLVANFKIGLDTNENYKWQLGSLAVPGQGFGFVLKPLH